MESKDNGKIDAGVSLASKDLEKVKAVLSLRDLHAADIMTLRSEIAMVQDASSIREVIEYASEVGYTKIPLYHEHPDNIIGFVNINKFLESGKTENLLDYKQEPVFVPETKNVFSLMQIVRKLDLDMVFVVNEYEIIVGIISKEDIAEMVVGDVYSKERSEEDPIKFKNGGKVLIDCKINLEELNERLNLDIHSETERTLAGYLLEQFGRFPSQGESLKKHLQMELNDEDSEMDDEKIIKMLETVPDFIIKKSTEKAIINVELNIEEDTQSGKSE
jgi:CBS domain containing-hemolysin-like protein